MAVRQRLTWIDWCKSIAIYLVILGHLPLQEQFDHFLMCNGSVCILLMSYSLCHLRI